MLETAGRVFAARGFHQASMDEIAELAGISKPMLYNYFGSKEGLYFAYVDLSYRELIIAVDSAVAPVASGHPEQELRAGIRAYYEYVGAHKDAFYVLFREIGDPGGALAEQRRRLRMRVALSLGRILEPNASAAAQMRRVEPLAEAFLGAARSLANWWLDHSEVSAESIADQLVDFTLGGILGARRASSSIGAD
jgi:AcrR family transcriptional regulator